MLSNKGLRPSLFQRHAVEKTLTAHPLEGLDESDAEVGFIAAIADRIRDFTADRLAQDKFREIVTNALIVRDGEQEFHHAAIEKWMAFFEAVKGDLAVSDFAAVHHPAVDEIVVESELAEGCARQLRLALDIAETA